MSALPWVRFYPSDWLAGTRGLSAAETGIYITLIASMYERGEPIPEDHARLARACGASNSSFKAALEVLVDGRKIVRVDGGLWNNRVGKESAHRTGVSDAARQAGLASGKARGRTHGLPSGNPDGSVDDVAKVEPKKAQRKQRTIATDVERATNENPTIQKPDTRSQIPEKKDVGASHQQEAREAARTDVANLAESKPLTTVEIGLRRFDDFWEIWPAKVAKVAAIKAWAGAVRAAGGADPILDGVWRYIRCKPADQKWCHAATFLNGQRWNDVWPPPVAEAPLSGISQTIEAIRNGTFDYGTDDGRGRLEGRERGDDDPPLRFLAQDYRRGD